VRSCCPGSYKEKENYKASLSSQLSEIIIGEKGKVEKLGSVAN